MKGLQGKVSFLILFSILFSIPLQASFAQTTSGTDETSDDLLQSFFKLFSDFIKLFTDQEQDDILEELEGIVETSRDTGATGVQDFGDGTEMSSGSATPTEATGTTGVTGVQDFGDGTEMSSGSATGTTSAIGYTGVQVIAKDTIGLSDGATAVIGAKGDNGEIGGDSSESGESGSESEESSSESGESGSESEESSSESGDSSSESGGSGSDSGGSGSKSGGSGSESGGSGTGKDMQDNVSAAAADAIGFTDAATVTIADGN